MTIEDLPDIVYHGTISIYKDSLLTGIDVNRGYYSADFGQGFYTTGNYEQAKNIAISRTDTYLLDHIEEKAVPMVITFKLDVMRLNEFKGIIFEKNSYNEWVEFVYNNRVGLSHIISNKHNLKGKYHYVYGFVADSSMSKMIREIRKNRITFGDFADNIKPLKCGQYNQLSFHSEEIVKLLSVSQIDFCN